MEKADFSTAMLHATAAMEKVFEGQVKWSPIQALNLNSLRNLINAVDLNNQQSNPLDVH